MPVTVILDADTFTRANLGGSTTIATGWGAASSGSAWSVSAGAATFSIVSNEGHITSCTTPTNLVLGSTSVANLEGLVRVKCSATTATRMGISLRCNGTSTYYMGRLSANNSAIGLSISKVIAGTSTDLFTTSFTVTVGSYYWIKFRAIGTTLECKAWLDGSGEPAGWGVSGTDSTLTSAGTFGLTLNATSSANTWDYDSFSVNTGSMTQTAQSRLRLAVQRTRTAQSRARLQVQRTLTAQSRARLRVLITRTAQARARLQVLTTKTAQARARLQVQRTLTAQVRTILNVGTLASKTAQTRVLLRILMTRTAQSRVLLRVLTTKTAQARARLQVQRTLTAQAKMRLRITNTRTAQARVLLQVLRTRTAQARVLLQVLRTRTAQVRLWLPFISTKTAQSRFRLVGITTRTAQARMLLRIPTTRTAQARIRLQIQRTRTAQTRALLRILTTRTAQARIRLQIQRTRTAQTRALLRILTTRTAQSRFRLTSFPRTRTAQARIRVRILGTKTAQTRLFLITQSISSGGFALYMNGSSGSVSIDHFRVVQYPDPALSLSPIVPRLGFCTVSWNELVDPATTLGIDASLDGVNWTDISGANGLQLSLLTAQPSFVIDGFTVNTASNYLATSRTGGTGSAWTIDTVNSRLVAVGGVNALYISQQVARVEVDIYVDMNRSDSGGIIWRYTDPNNFYYAVFTDNASTATPQIVTIYKVAANVQTTLASAPISFLRTLTTRCRVSMLRGLITASVDGLTVATYTDGSPLSGTAIGIYANGGTNDYSQLWIQPQGDNVSGSPPLDTVTSTFVYTRQRMATTSPAVTPYLIDLTIAAANPDISPGTLIPSITYDYSLVAANIDDLAKQSNFSWYINNREVIFRLPGAVPSPWVIQSASNGLPSWIEPDSNLSVIQANNLLYRNRQILKGVIGTDAFTNTFVNTGASTSFVLSYPIAPGTIPIITLDGIVQTVGLKGTTGSQWYYAETQATIAQDTSGIVQTTTGVILVQYTGTFIIDVVVDNTSAQAALALIEDSSGIVEEVEDVAKLNMYYPAALVYAQQLLARYCLTGRTLVFKTYRGGLDLLQIATVFFPEFNLVDAQMLITEIDIAVQTQPNDTVLYGYVVTATELPNMASWSKLLATNFLSGV